MSLYIGAIPFPNNHPAIKIPIVNRLEIITIGSQLLPYPFKKGGEPMKMSLTELGQGMVEYAFIIMLVAIVVIAALTLLGPIVGNLFSTINSSL